MFVYFQCLCITCFAVVSVVVVVICWAVAFLANACFMFVRNDATSNCQHYLLYSCQTLRNQHTHNNNTNQAYNDNEYNDNTDDNDKNDDSNNDNANYNANDYNKNDK